MKEKSFPVIDPIATGKNIMRLRKERNLTVRDLQGYFGFEEPQAIYKWQHGKSLPSVDNLYALGALFEIPMEQILIPYKPTINPTVQHMTHIDKRKRQENIPAACAFTARRRTRITICDLQDARLTAYTNMIHTNCRLQYSHAGASGYTPRHHEPFSWISAHFYA